jgi:hypothetical protein
MTGYPGGFLKHLVGCGRNRWCEGGRRTPSDDWQHPSREPPEDGLVYRPVLRRGERRRPLRVKVTGIGRHLADQFREASNQLAEVLSTCADVLHLVRMVTSHLERPTVVLDVDSGTRAWWHPLLQVPASVWFEAFGAWDPTYREIELDRPWVFAYQDAID